MNSMIIDNTNITVHLLTLPFSLLEPEIIELEREKAKIEMEVNFDGYEEQNS